MSMHNVLKRNGKISVSATKISLIGSNKSQCSRKTVELYRELLAIPA